MGRRWVRDVQAEGRHRGRRGAGTGGAEGGREEARIRLDANAAWSLEQATEILAAVEPLGIELVEQPVETIEEASELAKRTRIWLAGDESIVTLADAEEAIRADSFSVTGVKLSKVGGFELGREIAGRMRSYVASALDGPVGIAISRRLAEWLDSPRFAEERLAHGLATQRLFADTIAATECRLEGDLLHEAEGHGLGVTIDQDSLDTTASDGCLSICRCYTSNFPHMDLTNGNTALASAFVEELARGGVKRAVVSPGSRSTPLAVALWREAGIEVTVIVDERSAAFFALGAAQATGEPVALLCTSGTALANYHPAVAEADESALPLVVLSADRPPELRGIGAGRRSTRSRPSANRCAGSAKSAPTRPTTRASCTCAPSPARALAHARGEIRPGPVHLNLPWREPLSPIPVEGAVTATDPLALHGRDGARPLTAVTRVDLEPTNFVLDEVAGHIGDAIAGVIIAGRQTDPELREPLAHLARASGFPILADPTSQMRLGPHDRSYVVTTYDTLLRDEHWAKGVVPELVLRFGELPTSKPLRLGSRRAAPTRSSSTRRAAGTSRPRPPRSSAPTHRVRERLGGAPRK